MDLNQIHVLLLPFVYENKLEGDAKVTLVNSALIPQGSLNRVPSSAAMLRLETVSCLKTVLRHIMDVLVLVLVSWVGVSVLVLTSLS